MANNTPARRTRAKPTPVRELNGLSPKWLALGGGGYDLQAVARAWAGAYGVMAERELPEEIPAGYRKQYDVETLSDQDDLSALEQHAKDTRAFAEASVQAAQRLIFPMHGLRTG